MITGLPPDESSAFVTRLTPDFIDLTLDRLTTAIRGADREAGALALQRLRAVIDRAIPERPGAVSPLGSMPAIVGAAVTLQYPLLELEHFLRGEQCDIGSPDQAEIYLSFVRFHLWKLEQLVRAAART